MNANPSITKCSGCGEVLETTWSTCPACGTPSATGLICPQCEAPIKSHWKQCPRCQKLLAGLETPTGALPNMSSTGRGGFLSLSALSDPATSARRFELPIAKGDVLADRYEIIEQLGSGGFGAVYLAHDRVLRDRRAVKVVVAGTDSRATEQLIHEFRLREKIHSTEFIITAQDPRPADFKGLNLIVLPMALAEGGSFRGWLARTKEAKVRLKEGLEYFKQAAQGIQAIHDAGLAHLDIKPENILLVENRAKVTDFGIGRFLGRQLAQTPEQLIQHGLGTPQYMSPEQFHSARQQDIGPASDIYSLGLMLYELIDGSLPFDGKPIELREKHLHAQPPELQGESKAWWRIVERCLRKDAKERYPSVRMLIRDIERQMLGASILADVSCPKCGHLNRDPWTVHCEQCRENLSQRFRSCHRCGRDVRLDVDICRCGADVGRYYLTQERWNQVEKLKEEDPVEAIEMLELMLREGTGDADGKGGDKEAAEAVKDLRQMQKVVADLIRQAQEAELNRLLELSLEHWQSVLEMVSRHRIALGKAAALESTLKSERQAKDRSIQAMNEGRFAEAASLLVETLSQIPGRQDTEGLLLRARNAGREYEQELQFAQEAMRTKRIAASKKAFDGALSMAPESAAALAGAKEAQGVLDENAKRFEEATGLLKEARFEEATKKLQDIEAVQSDFEQGSRLEKQIAKSRKEYPALVKKAQEHQTAGDLNKAMEAIEKALAECSSSIEALTFREELRRRQNEVERLIQEISLAILAADFKRGEQTMAKAGELWSQCPKLTETRERLSSTKNTYTRHFTDAKKARSSKRPGNALEEVERALSACPHSVEADGFKQSVEADRAKARKHLEAGSQLILQARFDDAQHEVEQAEALWGDSPELKALCERLSTVQNRYAEFTRMAREALRRKKFEEAKDQWRKAREECPESVELDELKRTIQEAERTDRVARQRREQRWKEVKRWMALAAKRAWKPSLRAAPVAGVGIGTLLFWKWVMSAAWPWCQEHKLWLAAAGFLPAMVAALVHRIRYTDYFHDKFSKTHCYASELAGVSVRIFFLQVLLAFVLGIGAGFAGLASQKLNPVQEVTLAWIVFDLTTTSFLISSFLGPKHYNLVGS